jgi:hypothetical protein
MRNPLRSLMNYMSFVIMPLTNIALIAFTVVCGALIYTSFGGNGLGVAAVAGTVSGLAALGVVLAAYLYRPKSYRKAVADGYAKPIKLF